MTASFINHLWQSSSFALVAGSLAFALRNNSARVRYWVWLSASLKFLVPFALLVSLGSVIPRPAQYGMAVAAPAFANTFAEISEPFPPMAKTALATHSPVQLAPIAIGFAWVLGFSVVTFVHCCAWLRIRAALRTGRHVELPVPIPAFITSGAGEPGIVGFLRPALVLPAKLLEHLDPPELDAVLAHELCHVRRRDNLFAAIHMTVEAIFWFHPLVWWIGSRMLREREVACDEEVLRMGHEPSDYVEGILKVCRFYSESALPCVSGVTGSDVKKRLRAILAGGIARELSAVKKVILAAAVLAALATPMLMGVLTAPVIRAQVAPANTPKFEVASIRRCSDADFTAHLNSLGGGDGGRGGGGGAKNLGGDAGMLRLTCVPLGSLIAQTYRRNPNTNAPMYPNGFPIGAGPAVQGGPSWINDRYTILAKPETPEGRATMVGPMMQALLEDRFKLKVHRASREIPGYDLVVAKGGPKLPPPRDCPTGTPPPLRVDPGQTPPCGYQTFTDKGMDAYGWRMANLIQTLGAHLNRPVIDKTGISGAFDFHLDLPLPPPPGAPGIDDPNTPDLLGNVMDAVQKLGLKLDPTKGTTEFVVIDHIERPTDN